MVNISDNPKKTDITEVKAPAGTTGLQITKEEKDLQQKVIADFLKNAPQKTSDTELLKKVEGKSPHITNVEKALENIK